MMSSTQFLTISTRVATVTDLSRVTPTSTITETVLSNGQRRNRDINQVLKPLARQQKIEEAFRAFRRQNAVPSRATGGAASASQSSAFSSACSCQDYTGPTVTVSYTNAAAVCRLVGSFQRI